MIEIEENIVTADIARLLQQLGYSRECNHAYVLDKNGDILYGPISSNVRNESVELKDYKILISPTVDKALDYLVEVQKMYPSLCPLRYGSWGCNIYDLENCSDVIHSRVIENYKDALMYGIEYCCKYKLK